MPPGSDGQMSLPLERWPPRVSPQALYAMCRSVGRFITHDGQVYGTRMAGHFHVYGEGERELHSEDISDLMGFQTGRNGLTAMQAIGKLQDSRNVMWRTDLLPMPLNTRTIDVKSEATVTVFDRKLELKEMGRPEPFDNRLRDIEKQLSLSQVAFGSALGMTHVENSLLYGTPSRIYSPARIKVIDEEVKAKHQALIEQALVEEDARQVLEKATLLTVVQKLIVCPHFACLHNSAAKIIPAMKELHVDHDPDMKLTSTLLRQCSSKSGKALADLCKKRKEVANAAMAAAEGMLEDNDVQVTKKRTAMAAASKKVEASKSETRGGRQSIKSQAAAGNLSANQAAKAVAKLAKPAKNAEAAAQRERGKTASTSKARKADELDKLPLADKQDKLCIGVEVVESISPGAFEGGSVWQASMGYQVRSCKEDIFTSRDLQTLLKSRSSEGGYPELLQMAIDKFLP